MISLTIEKRYGAATVRSRVSAPSVERALELCGAGARLVLPDGVTRLPPRTEAEHPAKGPSESEFARPAA